MAQLKDWSCEYQLATFFPLTVGEKFSILCKGQTPINPTLKPSFESTEQNENFEIVILRHKFKSRKELFLSTASWKVGKHHLKDLKLNLGNDFVLIQSPKFEVKTLLVPKAEMHLPAGPKLSEISNIYWYGLALIGATIILGLAKIYRDSRRYDRGMLKLNSLKTGLAPFYEFQKQARLTKKTLEKSSEKSLTKDELIEQILNFYKKYITFVSLSLNYPIFIFKDRQVSNRFIKFRVSSKLVKQYFYIQQELKKVSEDIKSVQDITSIKSDFDSLVHEALDFAQNLNKESMVVKK